MSALWSVCKFVGLRGAALLGLGATGVAYHKSNEELKKDMLDGKQDNPYYFKQQADDFVQKTVLPLAKDGVQGLTSLTTATLSGAAGLAGAGTEQAPKVAEQAGNVIGQTTAAGKEASDNFFKKFVPKGWEGWATTAAVVAGGLGIMQQGFLGDGLKNAAGVVTKAPLNLATAAFGFAGQVLTPFAYIGAALAVGWLLLTPSGRELMSDIYQSVRSLFPGAPVKEPVLEHPHSPAPAIIKPEPKTVVPELMPDVSSIPRNFSGGDTVTVAPTRSSLGNDPAHNPRRDIKNSPPVSMSS